MIKKTISGINRYWWLLPLVAIFFWLVYVWWNCSLWPGKNCTGFVGKTVWDVLELLIIPATLAGVAAFLDKLERKTDRENANKRAEVDREIALDNQRELALQHYFDSMERVILDKNLRQSNLDDEVRKIAQVKTISTLKILNTNRKTELVNFLCEAGLIQGIAGVIPIINLSDIDLSEIQLNYVNLVGANFRSTNLRRAHLEESNLSEAFVEMAHLEEANLFCVNLEKANLGGAQLEGATLHMAKLSKAIFYKANLRNANLIASDFEEANLYGADLRQTDLFNTNLKGANLERANLEGANLESANLEGANLKKATMPDGIEYDPVIHTVEMLTKKSAKDEQSC
jgi:uncharacterized protein YjbI with pentapeptide repeats